MKVYVGRHAAQQERLAAFAHDIRTPMCCVTGAAQTAILRSRQGRDISEQMESILLAVRAMDRMLAGLCGEAQAQRQTRISQQRLTRELLAMAGDAARDKDQVLSIDLSALSDGVYVGDFEALARVLTNLLLNAVKYTQQGGVIRVMGRKEAAGVVCFTVSDNGMGMKPEFLERLFLPFERAKESAHLPGKGLGLAIVNRLAGRMGATVGVKSEWGRGTEFTVRVPFVQQESGSCGSMA